jgi:hypothetical protein
MEKMFGQAFLPFLVAVIIVRILNDPTEANMKFDGDGGFDWPFLFIIPLALFGLAYAFLFVPVIKYGEKYLFLKAMRDEETDLKVLFEGFKTKYLNIVGPFNCICIGCNGDCYAYYTRYNCTVSFSICSLFSNG